MIPIIHEEFGKRGAPVRVLAGDIGGTKTHLALFHFRENSCDLLSEKTYSSRQHQSFSEMALDFIGNQTLPDCISVGVAGPVIKQRVEITNLSYSVDAAVSARETGVNHVYLLNDLVANIYGLATLEDKDYVTFHGGNPEMKGNAAMISPGTGLGEAGMYWDGQYYHPYGTEGGHADYAPETPEDIELLKHLQKIYGHVSWERVVSGMGIREIYSFLCQYRSTPPSPEIQKGIQSGDAAALISRGSRAGDPLCQETMQMFWRNLANEAANIVMKSNAFGGVFIGGGIVPKNLDVLSREDFLHYFLEAGRMKKLLEQVPVKVVLNDRAALQGAAFYGVIQHRMELIADF